VPLKFIQYYHVGSADTKDIVATTDAVDGRVGDVPAAYASIDTAVLGVDHQICTLSPVFMDKK